MKGFDKNHPKNVKKIITPLLKSPPLKRTFFPFYIFTKFEFFSNTPIKYSTCSRSIAPSVDKDAMRASFSLKL